MHDMNSNNTREAPANAVWRAVCVSCGKSSEDLATKDDALRWSQQHRLEADFPSDIVLECRFRTQGGGTETRIFEQA